MRFLPLLFLAINTAIPALEIVINHDGASYCLDTYDLKAVFGEPDSEFTMGGHFELTGTTDYLFNGLQAFTREYSWYFVSHIRNATDIEINGTQIRIGQSREQIESFLSPYMPSNQELKVFEVPSSLPPGHIHEYPAISLRFDQSGFLENIGVSYVSLNPELDLPARSDIVGVWIHIGSSRPVMTCTLGSDGEYAIRAESDQTVLQKGEFKTFPHENGTPFLEFNYIEDGKQQTWITPLEKYLDAYRVVMPVGGIFYLNDEMMTRMFEDWKQRN